MVVDNYFNGDLAQNLWLAAGTPEQGGGGGGRGGQGALSVYSCKFN